MKQQTLNSHVKDLYHGLELSTQKRMQLQEQAEWLSKDTQQKDIQTTHWWRALYVFPRPVVGLSIMLVFFIGIMFVNPMQQQIRNEYLIAKEIALNHNKHLDSDFLHDNMHELGQAMSKLDFSLVDSDILREQGLRIAGARYCSIQGKMAAQIRLFDAQDTRYTLYQVGLQEGHEELKRQQQAVDGVSVRLWQEAGVLFGLAKSQ